MDTLGVLKMEGGRYEFRHSELGLVVRGDYAEWVLSAAAELIDVMARRDAEGRIEELQTLCEFGEADEIEIDSAKYDMRARFEVMPQCLVTMGAVDYRWIAPEGRDKSGEDFAGNPMKRISDMSLTRNDTFLENEDGVDTTNA